PRSSRQQVQHGFHDDADDRHRHDEDEHFAGELDLRSDALQPGVAHDLRPEFGDVGDADDLEHRLSVHGRNAGAVRQFFQYRHDRADLADERQEDADAGECRQQECEHRLLFPDDQYQHGGEKGDADDLYDIHRAHLLEQKYRFNF